MTAEPMRLLRRREVEVLVGKGRSALYAMLDKKSRTYDPLFPRPIRLGTRTVRWIESEILDYIRNLPRSD